MFFVYSVIIIVMKNLLFAAVSMILAHGAAHAQPRIEDLAPVCEMQIRNARALRDRVIATYGSEIAGFHRLTDSMLADFPRLLSGGDRAEEGRRLRDVASAFTRARTVYDGLVQNRRALAALPARSADDRRERTRLRQEIRRLEGLLPTFVDALSSSIRVPMGSLRRDARGDCNIRHIPDAVVTRRWSSLVTDRTREAARREAARHGDDAPGDLDAARSVFIRDGNDRITQCEGLADAHWDPVTGTVTVCMGMPMQDSGAYRACSSLELLHSSGEGMHISHRIRYVSGSEEYSEREFLRRNLGSAACRAYFDRRVDASWEPLLVGARDTRSRGIVRRIIARTERDARAVEATEGVEPVSSEHSEGSTAEGD